MEIYLRTIPGSFKEWPKYHAVEIYNAELGKRIWIDLTYAYGLMQIQVGCHEENQLFDMIKYFMSTGEVQEYFQRGLINPYER